MVGRLEGQMVDRLEDPRVARSEDLTVGQKADRSEDPRVGRLVDLTVDRSEDLMEGQTEGQKAETSRAPLLASMEQRVAWTPLLGKTAIPMQPASRALMGKKGASTRSTKDRRLGKERRVPVLLER